MIKPLPAEGSSDSLNQNQGCELAIELNAQPSNSSMNRATLSDAEHIELLNKEVRELRELVDSQKRLIHRLQRSNASSIVTSPRLLAVQMDSNPDNSSQSEIPQRSAKRIEDKSRRNSYKDLRLPSGENLGACELQRRSSLISITSNGPIDVNEGALLSPSLQTELNAASLVANSDEVSSCSSKVRSESEKRRHEVGTNDFDLPTGEEETTSLPLDFESDIHEDRRSDCCAEEERVKIGTRIAFERLTPLTSRSSRQSPFQVFEEELAYGDAINDQELPQCKSETCSADGDELVGAGAAGEDHKVTDPTYNHIHFLAIDDYLNADEALSGSRVGIFERQSAIFDNRSGSSRIDVTNELSTQKLNISIGPPTPKLPAPGQISSIVVSGATDVSSVRIEGEEDISLFIKPKDFSTIRIKVVSTITVNSKRAGDYNCTFSINDKESSKEMWRFRKSYRQLISFDSDVRPFIEFFGLPALPDRTLFGSTTPSKVDLRSLILQKYFDAIFLMPHIPQMVLLRFCKFISVDLVNPLDDYRSGARKEGYLIRRYKGLGTSWKVRWCQVDGPSLEIYDSPGGVLLEQIKLAGSQIGRQSSEATSEDRGYRHAFLVLERSKSLMLSGSSPKHFFCAESDLERDSWISALVEFTDDDFRASNENGFLLQSQHINYTSEELIQAEFDDGDNETISSQTRQVAELSLSLAQITLDETDHLAHGSGVLRQSKKNKMRQLFPFRSRISLSDDPTILPPLTAPTSSDQVDAEHTMEKYLDQMDLSDELSRAIFGRELEYAYNLSSQVFRGHSIPSICFRCLDFLERTGAIYEEGLFRLSGSASTIRLLKETFNKVFDVDLFDHPLKPDIHTVSGLLKTYLRELPQSILGDDVYHDLHKIATEHNKARSPSCISLKFKEVFQNPVNMNKIHYSLTVVIFGLLRSVISNCSMNKMSLKNVCIVFVPTLNISVDVLSICLTDYDCIFGELPPVPDHEREILDLQIPLL
ncbi:PX domain-containing protein [Metschnikowia aff. pulcherrima]|uniref:PX domain-containing protein n=1 Tax=Metschnikowia aff. pulcherrima TaxID=2163413 RepID=A0A4P6XSW0_9ASCO|nr:PX domain-containing protein [Metschnikowia aff. pulcherrima]